MGNFHKGDSYEFHFFNLINLNTNIAFEVANILSLTMNTYKMNGEEKEFSAKT